MATHYRGAPREVAALDAYIKLMRAAESVTARLDAVMAGARLTIGQFGTLEALLHLGPLCQRDLGRKLLRSNGNITVVVNNLVRRGLVRRVRRRDDRRFVTVRLTARGRRLISAIFPRHVAGVVRELAVLSLAEQAELERLCRRLGRQADPAIATETHRNGRGPAAGGLPHGVHDQGHGRRRLASARLAS